MHALPVRALPEPLARERLPLSWQTRPARAVIDRAIAKALASVERNLRHFGEQFPTPSSSGGVYGTMDNTEWTNGFWTGMPLKNHCPDNSTPRA